MEPVRLRENWVAAVLVFVVWDSLAMYVLFLVASHYGNAYLQDHIIFLLAATGGTLVLCEINRSVWTLRSKARHELDSDPPEGMEEGLLNEAE